MNRILTSLLAGTILLTSCETEPAESPLQAKVDSLESKLYHVSDTLEQLRKQVKEDNTWAKPTPSSQSTSDNDEVYESDDNNALDRIIDDHHGQGDRYVFATIEYTVDGDSRPIVWHSDINTLQGFSRDMQAKFLDECIKSIRRQPEVVAYNRTVKVLSRKAYMSYSYAKASEKLSQLRDGI